MGESEGGMREGGLVEAIEGQGGEEEENKHTDQGWS